MQRNFPNIQNSAVWMKQALCGHFFYRRCQSNQQTKCSVKSADKMQCATTCYISMCDKSLLILVLNNKVKQTNIIFYKWTSTNSNYIKETWELLDTFLKLHVASWTIPSTSCPSSNSTYLHSFLTVLSLLYNFPSHRKRPGVGFEPSLWPWSSVAFVNLLYNSLTYDEQPYQAWLQKTEHFLKMLGKQWPF